MNREQLNKYKKNKRDIENLDGIIVKLQERLDAVPVVSGKVTKSSDDFPYIEEHVQVRVEEPKENPVFDGKCLEVYLVTTKYGSSDQDKVYPFRAFWNGINFTDGWRILDVIAWMPLPEPYKEKTE